MLRSRRRRRLEARRLSGFAEWPPASRLLDGGDEDAGEDRRGDDAADAGAQRVRQDHGIGRDLGDALLGHLGRGRQAADAGDADHRIVLLAGGEVEDVAAGQPAEPGDGERHDAQDQKDQHVGIEDRVGLAEHAQEQTQEEVVVEEEMESSVPDFVKARRKKYSKI